MDKITLKAMLIKTHKETLQRLREEYASYQSGGNLNLEDVRDADDNSHREQTEEYLQAMERQIHQHENEIKLLRDLDFGPKTTITEGSVALVNGQYYIIGIPACQFEFEGKHFVAMSPDAPFYQELMDKNENDSFVFNNKQFTIESIF
jgi:transcription elongation GreA/GreB family factor